MKFDMRLVLFDLFLLLLIPFSALSLSAQSQSANSAPQQKLVSNDNVELKALFLDDQHDRGVEPFPEFDEHGKQLAPKTWPVQPDAIVEKHDRERRLRLHQILDSGAVITPQDYWLAALILHHGDKPDDYLLAHVLATTAAYKGNRNGRWLAAAALDRYLLSVSQKQIFGTQFTGKRGDTIQADYNPELLDDRARSASCVISREAQHKQWLAFQSGQSGDVNTGLISCMMGAD